MTATPKVKKKKRDYFAQADKLFGQLVRAPGRCIICGDTYAIQCAHGFSRRYRATRWDTRNAWALCRAHHYWYTLHPIEWDVWLHETWGEDLYDELRAAALEGQRPDLPTLIASLKAQLASLG